MELPASQQTVLTMGGMSLQSHPSISAISSEEEIADFTPEQPGRSASQPISGFDFMGLFACQCVAQMATDIQSKVTPEEWEKILAEARPAEEQPEPTLEESLNYIGPSM